MDPFTESPDANLILRPDVANGGGGVVGHYCIPVASDKKGGRTVGGDVLLEGSRQRALDQKVLAKSTQKFLRDVAGRLRLAANRGEAPRLIVPLNGVALGVRAVAGVFAAECRGLEKAFRDQLVFEIFNLPKDLSPSQVDDIAVLLFSFCRQYLARPNPGTSEFKVFTNCNFSGISLNLQDKPWPVEQLTPFLRDFVQGAEYNRLETYLHGVGTRDVADVAVQCGIGYMDGTAVAEPQKGNAREVPGT